MRCGRGSDAVDHRALTAWRLWERDHSTREIARRLGVSPATAWRLVERGEALPAHLRDRAELPELEAERREQAVRDRAAARRERQRRARLIAEEERAREEDQSARERKRPALLSPTEQREGEGEIASGDSGAARVDADARDPLPVGATGRTPPTPVKQ